jgi:2-oxoglutarate dehydrogenase E1 component
VGAKRFSVEGGEVMLAVMDQLHPSRAVRRRRRPRHRHGPPWPSDVLVNVCGKKPEALFAGFSEQHIPDTTHGDGDVKYHLGYAGARVVEGKEIGVTLAFNPSHLEAVNPVIGAPARSSTSKAAPTAPRCCPSCSMATLLSRDKAW